MGPRSPAAAALRSKSEDWTEWMAQNRIDHLLSSFKKLSRRPRGSRAALDRIAVSLRRTRTKASSVADAQANAYPVVVEWVAAVSPRALRGNPESVPHGDDVLVRSVDRRETEYSAGLKCFLAFVPLLIPPRLAGVEIGKRGAKRTGPALDRLSDGLTSSGVHAHA